jgi:peptidoglycan/LPS O-acetylase OafA/YrhL
MSSAVAGRSTLAAGPFPGFDGIRLLAAIAVLFSHAFLIAEGTEEREPLVRLLGAGNILGLYGVFTFFIISGFLLTRSLSRDSNPVRFAWNRFLRIAPAFLLCAAITSLVIGPLVSPLSLGGYFSRPTAYSYIAESLGCLCTGWGTPFEWPIANSMASTLNGSLWSLGYEVLSYVFLLWLWMIFRSAWPVAVLMLLTAVATLVSWPAAQLMPGIAYTLPYFAAGVGMYVVHRTFATRTIGAAVSAFGLVTAAALGHEKLAFAVFGAYLVIFLAERSNPVSRFARRAGDLSYGVYLFGWSIEQLLQIWTGARSGEVLFAYSLVPTLGVAAISWWVIERPCIRLKGYARAGGRVDRPGGSLAALQGGGDQPTQCTASDEAVTLASPPRVEMATR